MRELTRILSPVLLVASAACLHGQSSEDPEPMPRGHWRIESDTFLYSHDKYTPDRDGITYRNVSFGDFLLSTGLCSGCDVEFGYTGWSRLRSIYPEGEIASSTSRGNVTLRSKLALIRPDEGAGSVFSLTLLPFVCKSCEEHGHGGVGLILPWGWRLSDSYSVGGMVGYDRGPETAYDGEIQDEVIGTLYVSRTLDAHWAVYLEYASGLPLVHPRCAADSLALGLVWNVTERFSLDASYITALRRTEVDETMLFRLSWKL